MTNHLDKTLFWSAIMLIIIGIVVLADVSAPLSQVKFGYPTHFLFHQLLFAFLPGVVLAFVFYKIPLKLIKKYASVLFLLSIVASVAVLIPSFGERAKGAMRWLSVGPFSFQPSEFLKLFFIIYLAYWFSKKDFGKLKNFSVFLLLLGIVSAILYFQRDLSTLAIILASSLTMYFLADAPWRRVTFIVLLGVILVFAMIKFEPYRFNRLLVLFNPQMDPLGIGYQSKQALITIGSGGILGQGLGMGKQKFGFLPESISDSVFAILAEGTGFLGSTFVIVLLFVLFWRGFSIASHNKDKFIKLLAYGISIWFIFQALLNIGGMIHVMPLAGVPLPFISYGGSHIVAELIGLGLLLNASKYCII